MIASGNSLLTLIITRLITLKRLAALTTFLKLCDSKLLKCICCVVSFVVLVVVLDLICFVFTLVFYFFVYTKELLVPNILHYKLFVSLAIFSTRLAFDPWMHGLVLHIARVPIIAEKYTSFLYYSLHVSCHVIFSIQISAQFIYLV